MFVIAVSLVVSTLTDVMIKNMTELNETWVPILQSSSDGNVWNDTNKILSLVSVQSPVKPTYLYGIPQECKMCNEYDLFFEADVVSWRQCKKNSLKLE